ncbi:TonB-dependent hemoglobin/transferrin/lactoferrin family receptor [Pleionea sp. CnH1-48]|uniref:TonB-dependent hemoglobin/transferrin/lactoferrin family receptor n=1 Tax=Pleionea sp. CnH1-48 TaxID=2954494 RepID=UPI002096A5BA|nr:TonB-dependent hemoglobin/transferrin/lactoferrin family receptor [Pleionea sp. CnH1-48]MCO7222957.1 TonB-dependent hemoglobin/transferrin/lactoferrin family receptor [Pleionea sp. CnH1-48]
MTSKLFALTLVSLAVQGVLVSQAYAEDDKAKKDSDGVVTVTATRLERAAEDVAATVTVIDGQQLEKELANDLDDLVRYQPGITLSSSARGGNTGFNIRGIGGNRVLMLVDGVRSRDIYFAGPSAYGSDLVDVSDLSSAEIIRGPASALYGADALGGVVLLNTKDPVEYLDNKDDTYLRLDVGAASADEQINLGVTAAGASGDWSYLAKITGRTFKEKDIEGGTAQLNPTDGDSTSALFKLVYAPNETHKLGFVVDYFEDSIDYNLLTDLSSSVTASTGMDDNERVRFSVEYDWQADSAFADTMSARFYTQTIDGLQHTEQDRLSFSFPFAPFGTPASRVTDFEFNQDIIGISANLLKTIDSGSVKHSMVYGFSYESFDTERPRHRCDTDNMTNTTVCDIRSYPFAPPESFPNKTFPDTDTTRIGVFWQDEMVLGDSGFTVIPGVRYDNYKMDADTANLQANFGFPVESFDESEVSTNLGVIYELNNQTSFFLQYAEGFRAPNFDEANQSFVNLGHGYAIVPNPDLKPETSEGVELGFKSNLSQGYLSMSIFENNYEDFISTQFIGQSNGISLFQDSNIGRVRIKGLEANLIWNFNEQWRLRQSLAYASGTDSVADVPLDSIEPLTIVSGVGFDNESGDWGMEAVMTLVNKKDAVSAPTKVTNNSYALFDVFGHYQINKKAKVQLGIFNLFNRQYARWSSLQGVNASDSDTIARRQEAGIEYRVGFSYEF